MSIELHHETDALSTETMAEPIALCPAPIAVPTPRPWGFWATVGWFAAVIGVELIVGIVCLIPVAVVAVIRNPKLNVPVYLEGLISNGLFMAVMTVATNAAAAVVVCIAIWVRKFSVRQYLGLAMPRARTAMIWTLPAVAWMIGSDLTSYLTGHPIVHDSMASAYRTAGWLPLLVFAVVIVAPVMEEVLFRGFMFKGLAASRVGVAGAIVITSVIFASLHVQYDLYGIVSCAILGLILGYIRHKTGSTSQTIMLHAIINLVATIETAIFVHNSVKQ